MSNLTDRSTTPCPVACVAGWIVMRAVLSWRRSRELTPSNLLAAPPPKYNSIHTLIPPAAQGICPEAATQL